MRFTLVYKGCSEFLEGVGLTRIHRISSTLVDKGWGDSLDGLDMGPRCFLRCTMQKPLHCWSGSEIQHGPDHCRGI